MKAIVTLVDSVKDLQQADSKARLQAVASLLKNPVIYGELSERKVRRKLSAERFNIFSALWLDRRENYHSRFLAYLLDAQGDHDQGTFFLKRLLQVFVDMSKGRQFPKSAIVHEGNSRVVAEQIAVGQDRIDLVIYLANHMVIAIENKIDHYEGERQLPRYRKWLMGLKPSDHPKFLVFLTPDRREPELAQDRVDAEVDLLLGYSDLVRWLDICISDLPATASRLVTVLFQYQQICKSIAGEFEVNSINEDILKLIRQPENLRAALEIATHLNSEKLKIAKVFQEHLISELKKLLSKEKITDWCACADRGTNVIGIYHFKHISEGTRNYICGIQNLFSSGYFGWCRPQDIDPKQPEFDDTVGLSLRMRGDGHRERDKWWVCWDPLVHPFDQWNDDTIVLISSDNNDEEFPLAKELAKQVWAVFLAYRPAIEELPSFQKVANAS